MKQALIIRKDLNMTPGKIAAQVAHASVEAVFRSPQAAVEEWHHSGMKKIVLRAESKEQLYEYQRRAKAEGLVAALITDGGHTQVEPGTVTCLGIGPAEDTRIDKVTKDLKLYP